MNLFEFFWWFFDVGGEKSSPDVQHSTNKPSVHAPSAPEPDRGGTDEIEQDQAEFDDFFGN